nr:hypothetical protein CFP56_73134 [Quercus suber]
MRTNARSDFAHSDHDNVQQDPSGTLRYEIQPNDSIHGSRCSYWLAGQKAAEESVDLDATGAIDVPETPAPVFAVRAFKHAIFGTPQTVQPKARRHSNTEATRPRTQDGKSQRPPMTRPKSASYAQDPMRTSDLAHEPMNSPTKGILLTPGTAAAKRKTVSFGDHIKDRKGDHLVDTEEADECPKNASNQRIKVAADDDFHEESSQRSRNGGSLTKALEQVRDESAKRKRASRETKLDKGEEGMPDSESTDPQPESARYWKAEYDAYRENTQREVRKLVKKQQMAKNYAKTKDDECMALKEELRQERLKVAQLEGESRKLNAQLKEQQTLLRNVQGTEHQRPAIAFRMQKDSSENFTERPAANKELRTAHVGRVERLSERRGARMAEAVEPPVSRESRQAASVPNEAKTPTFSDKPVLNAKAVGGSRKDEDDIWAPSFSVTSLSQSKGSDKPPSSPTIGRTVTCGTGATPLKSLSINTLPTARMTRRDSAQPSPPTETAVNTLTSREAATQPSMSMPALTLPFAGTDRTSLTGPRDYKATHRKINSTFTNPDLLPASSPFQPDAPSQSMDTNAEPRDIPGATQPLIPLDDQIAGSKKRNATQNSLNPSAAWMAIGSSAPAPTGKRVTSITDKHGNEVAHDRLEAAKARLRAKGRNVS